MKLLAVILFCIGAQAQNLAPNFEGTLKYQGKGKTAYPTSTFRLSEVIGKKTIVLNFFATWCGPCKEEMPALNQYFKEHADEMLLLGVDGEENPAVVLPYVESNKIEFPVLVDAGDLKRAYGITNYPGTVVIGTDGRVQFSRIGVINVHEALDFLLKKNSDLVKAKKAVTSDSFMKSQKVALIKVVDPEAKPIDGFDASKKDEIFDIKVVKDNPKELEVEVDFYYSGSLGADQIAMDCDVWTKGLLGESRFLIATRPMIVRVGRNKVVNWIGAYDQTPDGKTNEIRCAINSRLNFKDLAKKTIRYDKSWQR